MQIKDEEGLRNSLAQLVNMALHLGGAAERRQGLPPVAAALVAGLVKGISQQMAKQLGFDAHGYADLVVEATKITYGEQGAATVRSDMDQLLADAESRGKVEPRTVLDEQDLS